MRSHLIALLLAAAVAGCGTTADPEPGAAGSGRSATSADTAEPSPPELDVTIDSPRGGKRTTASRVRVTGTVSPPDARVTVNGRSADVEADGTWTARASLELGTNGVRAVATTDGTTDRAVDTVEVVRRRTAAQRAAFREAQRRKRERRLAELKASARAIDPELLQKNPDKHAGERVVVSGEIFQIQEDSSQGNFMMINTGCETSYDIRICDGPTVHISYRGTNDKTEDDFVTVYGTVVGGLEYETAIGGSNFVASIEAEIVE
jgi:hypothetical protein